MAGYCGKCNQHYDCSWREHDEECEGTTPHDTNRERLENYQRDNDLTNDEMTDFICENNIDY